MDGLTMAEKVLSQAAGRQVRAGELAICTPDIAMGTDGSIPMALQYLQGMANGGLVAPRYCERLVFALDHYGAPSGERALALQQQARDYASAHGVTIFEAGEGIGHQLMLERGLVRPGQLLVGADSHSTSYGAANAFATGIGSSDLAGVLLCGQVWLKVPESLRVRLHGRLPADVSAKDLALHLARQLGADGATYKALEYGGSGIASLDMDDRIVLANMAVEMGAKAGMFPYDETTHRWLVGIGVLQSHTPVSADGNAHYARDIDVDLTAVRATVALPHRVDNVVDLLDVPPTRVDMVYLGTCTGGRLKDYQDALQQLRAHHGIAPGVQVVVTPASESIQREMERNGMMAEFQAYGALIQPPGCGSCCGTCGVTPANGANVVSTANRNFKGRMGTAEASIFLASPTVCGIAAATGELRGKGARS